MMTNHIFNCFIQMPRVQQRKSFTNASALCQSGWTFINACYVGEERGGRPAPLLPTFNVEYGTSNLFILKDLCRKGMTVIMKKADNICPYCGAKISYREKAKIDHRCWKRCKICGNQFTISTKWSVLFLLPSFLVFLLVLFDVKIEIVGLLLIPSFVLFTVLQLLFAPIIKKDQLLYKS